MSLKMRIASLLIIFLLRIYATEISNQILILNDMHYNPNLTTSCNWGYCTTLGIYNEDSDLKLIETVLDRAK